MNFHNVLVGIDLTRCSDLQPGTSLGPVNEGILRRDRWLASTTGCRLTYLAALNENGQPWHLIDPEQHPQLHQAVEQSASAVLLDLVGQDRQSKLDAHALLAPGKGPTELLQESAKGLYDMVLIGTRAIGGWRRTLFGNTGYHLLRQCPCPVWVSQPSSEDAPTRILVASDLSPASEAALDLALALSNLSPGSRLQVLHVVDYPLDRLWSTGLPDDWEQAYRNKVRAEATAAIRAQLHRAGVEADGSVGLVFRDGAGIPDETILEFIQQERIDLLVLGTHARGGVEGFLLGNTAERLLHDVRCSLVAVKGADLHAGTSGFPA